MSAPVKKKKKTGTSDHNKLIAIIAIILGVIVVAAVSIYFINYFSNNYVGKVDGVKMYDYEYTHYVESEINSLYKELSALEFDEDATDEEKNEAYKKYLGEKDENGKYALDRVKENALEKLRLLKVETALAKQEGYTLTKDEESNVETNIEYMINYYYQLYQQQGSSVDYNTILQQVCGNMTLEQYKEYAKQDMTINKWKEALKETYDVTDADARKKYDESPEDYNIVTIQKFFLKTQTTDDEGNIVDMTDEEKAEVKTKIDDYLAKFESGELEFEATIKEYSEEDGSADDAGIKEISISSKTGVTEVDEWAMAKKAADEDGVYTLIETETGYYIVRCTAVEDFDNSVDVEADEEAGTAAKDSIKTQIIKEIKQEKADKEVEDKAEEVMKVGYPITNLNESRILDLVKGNSYVEQLVSIYEAKISE